MTSIPPFRPGNYPRIYKHRIEQAVSGYIMAGFAGFFAVFCLLTVAIKYHGDLAAGGACSAVGILGLIFTVVGLVRATAPRLTLTADVIEYRNIGSIYVVTRRMRLDNIKGVTTTDTFSPGSCGGSFCAGTTFMPKDENTPALFVPEWIFALDETYDAWVRSLPYLGGLYTLNRPFSYASPRRFAAEDLPKVEWREHTWSPRTE